LDKHAGLLSTGSKKPSFFYGYIVVLAAFFIMVIMSGLLYSFGVFLKPLSTEFGWTRAMTAGAHSMTLFVTGLLYMVTGRLTDRFGPRIVTTACGFFLGSGCLLMSQLSALWQLYLFWGVIVAMGLSGGFVPMTSTVARWFAKRRGLMTGIVVAGVGTGTMIVPPVASWLISSYGWRTAFIVIGIIALLLLILAAQFLKRDPSKIGQLPYGENEVKPENLISEARGASFREAIHTKQFQMIWAVYFLLGTCVHTIMVHIVPHATDLGISAMIAANILAVVGGLSIVGRVGIGIISDRVGRKLSLVIGFILLVVALLWLPLARELWMLYLFAIIFGFSYGGLITLESPVVAELFGLRAHGAILGALVFGATTGGAIGPILAGHIFDIANSYYLAFMACAGLSITGLIVASLLKPIRRQDLR